MTIRELIEALRGVSVSSNQPVKVYDTETCQYVDVVGLELIDINDTHEGIAIRTKGE